MIIQQSAKEKRKKTNRRNRIWINKDHISKALEKARDSARKSKHNGILPSDLSSHLPRENLDGTPLKLVQWKDSPVDMQASMYQLALAEIEATSEKMLIPFVFCLSESLIDKADKSSNGMAAYIHTRLKNSLKQTLVNRDKTDVPVFWFSFELAKKKHYHIQGAIVLYPHETKKSKKAFYKIYGDVPDDLKSNVLRFRHDKRQNLIDEYGQLATDIKWALYNSKEEAEIKRDQFSEHVDIRAGRPVEAPIKIKRVGAD
jgi:hypothetical protein